MKLASMLAGVTGALAMGPALAADRTPGDWRALTQADVEAAHALVRDNHPGAAAEIQDADFRRRLEAGLALARTRAAKTTDFGGYAATMRGLAGGLGDAHLRWRPSWHPGTVRYPGFWVDLNGRDWIVVARDDEAGPQIGARLFSCDGVAADDLAQARLAGFRMDATVPAQMTAAAPWLMIDEANPFVPLPGRCAFAQDGKAREHVLTWRPIAIKDMSARSGSLFPRPGAGFGVRAFPGGTWIAMDALRPEASAVVEETRKRWSDLKSSPVIVVDLRGNGGGDSSIGDDLAGIFYGAKAVDALDRGKPGCSPVWRASAGNLRTLEQYQTRFADRGPKVVAGLKAQADEIRAAMAAGRPLSGPVAGCLDDPRLPAPPASPAKDAPYQGKVVILTDGACFSSCLLMTQRFRAWGAIHAGRPTNAATWYMEVRDEPLPSGLGTFSTLGKAGLNATRRLGPFVPAVPYERDMTDTAALETWVAKTFAE